mgnify:FL=1
MTANYKYLPRWGNSFLERYFLLLSIDILLLFGVVSTIIEDIFDYKYQGFLKDSGNPIVIILRLIIGYGLIYAIEYFIVKKIFYINKDEIMRIKKQMSIERAKRITIAFQIIVLLIFNLFIFFRNEILNLLK